MILVWYGLLYLSVCPLYSVVQNNAITEPVKEVAASVTPPLPHEEKAPAAAGNFRANIVCCNSVNFVGMLFCSIASV